VVVISGKSSGKVVWLGNKQMVGLSIKWNGFYWFFLAKKWTKLSYPICLQILRWLWVIVWRRLQRSCWDFSVLVVLFRSWVQIFFGLKLLTYNIVSVILLILAFDMYFITCRLMVVSTVSMFARYTDIYTWHLPGTWNLTFPGIFFINL
jgi:hypothetical protein